MGGKITMIKNTAIALAGILAAVSVSSGSAAVVSEYVTQSFLKDTGFQTAFATAINGVLQGNLETGARASGYWVYDQSNSAYQLSAENSYTSGTTNVYYASGEKKLFIDPSGRSVYLYMDSSYDYSSPRAETQPIAAVSLRQPIKNDIPIAEVSELTLTTDFYIAEYENLNGTAYNEHIHTAQLQISLMVKNNNMDSAGYGDYYLFVLPLFDARYNSAPAYDNGVCDENGKKYIKNLSAEEFLFSAVVPAQSYSVDFDITQKLYNVFTEAKSKNYLTGSDWEDMCIGEFSITLSMPGSYKTGCYFSNLGLEYKINLQNAYLDENYSEGFNVYTTEEGNGMIGGVLTATDTPSTPVWTLAQWNSVNDLTHGYRIVQDDLYLWGDNSKQVFIRRENNTLGLLMNASAEYQTDRVANQPWPCLLLNQEFDFNHHLKVDQLSALFMNVDFCITKMENHMKGQINPDLHAAQLLWYITVQNRNTQSADFGKYIWFGLQLYDSRYTFPTFYADEDGGKEVNTGMFIYQPEATDFLEKAVTVGEFVSVEYNALSRIRQAFALAQSRGYLTNTAFEDLYIGAMNIGWELPGTFDVCVEISDLNLYPVYK